MRSVESAVESPTVGRRAIGIVRVSQVAGREGEGFASPAEQRERIAAACGQQDLALIETVEELDVSGGTPLEARHGLRGAIEAVERGQAEVIIAAYFDRLVRSLRVQGELVSRVERAGGQILALDVGAITEGTAGQWLSGTMLGAVSEYHRRSVRERSGEAQARAVARGVAPWPSIPIGYLRREDGVLIPDPPAATLVLEAFQMRVDSASIRQIREHLQANGITVSYSPVQRMLSNRVYLGEIHFGDLSNLEAHEPIVPRELWSRVQSVRVPRGRRPKSARLLARLGVLRCGGCNGRMGVSTSYNGTVPIYRCPASTSGDCPTRATIGAEIAETVVVGAVREALSNVEGRASAESDAREADAALERAQADLDAAIRAFRGLEDEAAARQKLAALREARDQTQVHADHLRGLHAALVLPVAADWDRLSTDERRGFIRAVVSRAVVGPGRGASRISVELVGEEPAGG